MNLKHDLDTCGWISNRGVYNFNNIPICSTLLWRMYQRDLFVSSIVCLHLTSRLRTYLYLSHGIFPSPLNKGSCFRCYYWMPSYWFSYSLSVICTTSSLYAPYPLLPSWRLILFTSKKVGDYLRQLSSLHFQAYPNTFPSCWTARTISASILPVCCLCPSRLCSTFSIV